MSAEVKTMRPTALTATRDADILGIAAGDVVHAVQWDGSDHGAEDILRWVDESGGTGTLSDGTLVVVDHGDLAFARPGSWIVDLRGGEFTSVGDTGLPRLFSPAVVISA